MSKRVRVTLAAFTALGPALSLQAMYQVSDSGTWPTNWPKELEPLRKQARTLAHDGFVVDLNRIPLPADTPIIDKRFSPGSVKRPVKREAWMGSL